MIKLAVHYVLLILLCSTVVSCGATERPSAGSEGLQVSAVSANLALPSNTGAIYMRIANNTDREERLIGASVPGCGVIELHEMTMEGDLMRMREAEGGEIAIPAGEIVELKPGGLHLMCIDKTGDYGVGDSVSVTLEFANAGTIKVPAEVVPPREMDS